MSWNAYASSHLLLLFDYMDSVSFFLDKNPSVYMQFIALIFKLNLVYVIYLRIDIKIVTISMASKSIEALLIRVQCTRTY